VNGLLVPTLTGVKRPSSPETRRQSAAPPLQ
jgi:hypothetical protein